MLFGGRIAEELFMNQMTTGASNDFERATAIARDIVTRYGMDQELGPMVYAENEGEVFLGRSVTKTTHVSEATMQKVDASIRRIIDEQYDVARKILEGNRDKVEAMAAALLEWGNHRRGPDRRHRFRPSAASAQDTPGALRHRRQPAQRPRVPAARQQLPRRRSEHSLATPTAPEWPTFFHGSLPVRALRARS